MKTISKRAINCINEKEKSMSEKNHRKIDLFYGDPTIHFPIEVP